MLAGLLDQPGHPVPVQDGDAEPLRLRDLGQEDLGARPVPLELLDEPVQAFQQDVVTQVHHERLVADEVLRRQHGVGQAERRLLADVRDAESPGRSVLDGRTDLARRVADHDADLPDAGVRDGLQGMEQDRRVRDGDELLGVRVRDRAEPRPLPSREDERLHPLIRTSRRAQVSAPRRAGPRTRSRRRPPRPAR